MSNIMISRIQFAQTWGDVNNNKDDIIKDDIVSVGFTPSTGNAFADAGLSGNEPFVYSLHLRQVYPNFVQNGVFNYAAAKAQFEQDTKVGTPVVGSKWEGITLHSVDVKDVCEFNAVKILNSVNERVMFTRRIALFTDDEKVAKAVVKADIARGIRNAKYEGVA